MQLPFLMTTWHSDDTLAEALWFATVAPAYLDKTNATTIHAALRLDADIALDFNGAARSAIGALKTALTGNGSVLLVTSDLRSGQPGRAPAHAWTARRTHQRCSA